jgi:hypothetical protein
MSLAVNRLMKELGDEVIGSGRSRKVTPFEKERKYCITELKVPPGKGTEVDTVVVHSLAHTLLSLGIREPSL